MSEKKLLTEIISVYPYDEGQEAARKGIMPHLNPYKSPNTPKTDDVKAEAWSRGYSDLMSTYGPV
jgi:hypothetical protein